MNAQTRKDIAEKIGTIEQLIADIEAFRDDEQEKYDNMPEGLQQGEAGEKLQTAIDALESAVSSAGEAKDYLEEAAQ